MVQLTLECNLGSILWRLHGLEESADPDQADVTALQADTAAFFQQLGHVHQDVTEAALKNAVFAMQADLMLVFGKGKLEVNFACISKTALDALIGLVNHALRLWTRSIFI